MLRISLSNSKRTNEEHIKNSKYFLVIDPICSTTQNDHTLWLWENSPTYTHDEKKYK